MNILVTGGTGFVGKPLVEALLSRGDTVTVLTRSIEKAQAVFSEKIPQFLTALLRDIPKLSLTQLNIEKLDEEENASITCELIFQLNKDK